MTRNQEEQKYPDRHAELLDKSACAPIHTRDVSTVHWTRIDNYDDFRAEMREEQDDFPYNFNHKLGPDPMQGVGDHRHI